MKDLRIIYPDGSSDVLVEADVSVDDLLATPKGDFAVRYVRRSFAAEETTAFLGLLPGSTGISKVATFVVAGNPFLLCLAEAAELGDRLRRMSTGEVGSPTTAAAVRIEQLVDEETGASPRMDMTPAEEASLRWGIEGWLLEVGASALPERVMDLRYALHSEANDIG